MTEATAYRTHTCGSLRKEHAGRTVRLGGWIHARREHRSILFLDIRDRYGITQAVVSSDLKREMGAAEPHDEDVVLVEGTVAERPPNLRNPNIATGDVELQVARVTVVSRAKTPPFEITRETDTNEDVRLRYRYLDLRRERLKRNMLFRDEIISRFRALLHDEGFVEIETPILTKSTPEGARDYIVPSRLHPGRFYALPQSPQQYKQLLMVAGLDRYFQIARCFRDEDQRGDRQPEFTQLDMEMSFVDQEDVIALTERVCATVITGLGARLAQRPFPRLSHADALQRYGTDRPDIRTEEEKANGALAFLWVTDFPLFETNSAGRAAAVTVPGQPSGTHFSPSHHMFTAPVPEDIPLLDVNPSAVRSTQYDLVCNGYEIGGGSIRIHDRGLQEKIFGLVGLDPGRAREQFGHLLEAFDYGVPPHGGIAPGLDRLLMVMRNEPNIREVIAFPKNQQAEDVLFGAPSPVEPSQLKDLHLTLEQKKT